MAPIATARTLHSRPSSHAARQTIVIRSGQSLLGPDIRELWQYRELLGFLILRDFKIRYKQAFLGIAWAILQPVFAVVIFAVVFGHFAKMPSDGLPYPAFAFAALLPWTYFAEAVRRCGVGLVGESELIRKIYFPRLIIPLAGVIGPLAELALSFLVLLGLLAWYGIVPTVGILCLPALIAVAMLQALALGLWLGPINVRYRDVMHTLPFMLQIWMYASPIIYPLSIVPEAWRTLYSLNPMVGVIEGFRWALVGGPRPDLVTLALSVLLPSILLTGGLLFFRKMERSFADVI